MQVFSCELEATYPNAPGIQAISCVCVCVLHFLATDLNLTKQPTPS